MVQIEYRLEDSETFGQRILFFTACFFLFLLLPSTALGYFAEKSIPGQPLYSIKRGIEAGILALESLTPYGKTNYLLSLAQSRVNEAAALVDNAHASGDYSSNFTYSDAELVDMVNSLKQAQVSIQQISDPIQKKEAEQHLTNAIQNYQNNLQKMAQRVQESSTNYVGLEKSITITAPSPTSNSQENATPTPFDNQNAQDSTQQLEQQIQQTQSDLQDIQERFIVSPHLTPFPTPTIIPTFMPSPTLLPQFHDRHRSDSNNNHTDTSDH